MAKDSSLAKWLDMLMDQHIAMWQANFPTDLDKMKRELEGLRDLYKP